MNLVPFPHLVVEDFFPRDMALELEAEFPAYDDPAWFVYDNPLESKKTLNNWERFPAATYQAFSQLCGANIEGNIPDIGLHGGGWHIMKSGGNLNPHRDYEMHPKLKTHRKLNLIVYLSSDYKEEYGGELGLWDGDSAAPGSLVKKIWPKFNRAVVFDVSGNGWHGLASPVVCPEDVYRRSIALYYTGKGDGFREKALFAPREEQAVNKGIEDLIQRRAWKGDYK